MAGRAVGYGEAVRTHRPAAGVGTAVLVATLLCLGGSILPTHAAGATEGSRAAALSPPGAAPLVGPRAASTLLHERVAAVALPGTGLGSLQEAGWFAYDPAAQEFYVAVPPQNVDLVRLVGGSPTVVGGIPVGSDPFGVAVDNATGDVFVTNEASDNVSVIFGAAVIGSIPVGTAPTGIAYDFLDRSLFVANSGSANVSVISGASLAVVASTPVGLDPLGVAYDPVSDRVFVADHGSAAVSVLAGASGEEVARVGVGLQPFGVALDNVSENVYVTNAGSSNLSVLSTSSLTVVATVPILYPGGPFGGPESTLEGLAFDPADGMIWVGAGTFYTIVVDPVNETVVGYLDVDPSGVVYDPSNGDVCLTETANVSFACFVFPGIDGTPTVTVTFSESGLPAGTAWNVTIASPGPEQVSTSPTIVFGVSRGIYTFVVGPTRGYAPDPSTGVVNATGGSATVEVEFVYAPGPFTISFAQTGLPPGTSWSVEVKEALRGSTETSTGSTLEFEEPSGTYHYLVRSVPGWQETGLAPTGEIEVDDADVQEPTMTFSPYTFPVTFTETGLPAGTLWSVDLGGTAQSASVPEMEFAEPNGSYDYSVAPVAGFSGPTAGSVTVDGAAESVVVPFQAHYPVTFGEAGLAPGTEWSVTLGGTALDSTVAEIAFSEANGTYSFTVGGATGYAATPSTGTIVVAGGPQTQGISFAPVPSGEYPVVFSETGLTAGIGWSVVVSNRTLGVDTTLGGVAPGSITFYLANGTYAWGVFVPAGYASTVPSGPLVVAGPSNPGTTVAFVPASGPAPSPHGPSVPWVTIAVGVGAAAGGVLVGFAVRRRNRSGPV